MRTTKHQAALVLLGGVDVDPQAFLRRYGLEESFRRYMEATGARHVDWGKEVLVPPADKVDHWTRAGSPSLVPPLEHWDGAAALVALVMRLRRKVRTWIAYRYVYRPRPFNVAVGGAANSDHLYACAADLVFPSNRTRLIALGELRPLWTCGLLGLSIGTVGADYESRKMHVGVWAPATVQRGQRRWVYGPGDDVW